MKKFKNIVLLTMAGLILTPLVSVTNAQATVEDEFPLEVSRTTQTQKNYNSTNISTSDITQNEHFANNTIAYYITPGIASGVQKDIRAAALEWNINTKVNLYETTNKSQAAIVFTNKGTDSSENGLTSNTINRSKGYKEVVSSSIDLSKNTIPQNSLSVMGRRVAEHELGHALGLKDTKTDQTGSIMWYRTPQTDITAKDIAAINLYYK
ncbi:matrixin family metalloprotease [Companilactobacillus versmoldensis]|uniref:Extracellular zinc metalloproteinase n=1 Tax=Companilactobacillus versmoldensis DSM 14857 = KCTC 3814 TaxID=1423815 RepID=A0A0R1SDM9_9LACO|nr:matrixin family metalloprotease [Companilactobacillus versmoldensis]KRL67327.1 extracellular zinc metalloproteinase [Companilactobacillus versmoldensis DSM 14857 = KCTC 3814]